MNIRLATKEDMQEIYDLLVPYQAESWFNGAKVDKQRSIDYINAWIDHAIAILAYDDDLLVGISVVAFTYTFWEEKEGEIDFMYVRESHRKTNVSRILRDESIRQMDYNGAEIQYAMSASAVQEQLFINLWAKRGFKKLGVLMARDLTKKPN